MKVDESSNYLISLFGLQLSYTFVQCILCSPIEFETSQQLKATGNLLQVRPADFSNFAYVQFAWPALMKTHSSRMSFFFSLSAAFIVLIWLKSEIWFLAVIEKNFLKLVL